MVVESGLGGNTLSFNFLTHVSVPFPLPVDSPDLVLGVVHDCGPSDGGALHNSGERCHR